MTETTVVKKKNGSAIQRRLIPTYIFLIFVSFLSVFPFYWMISAATNSSVDVARGKITLGLQAAQNFQNLLASQPLWAALRNSFFYSILQTLLCLFICSLAGYGFELYHDKAKDKVFAILLLAMMVPQVATMIPLFKMMSSMHLLNNIWAFVLPAISTPFMIMMFRQNSRSFPVDIMEAARIDGLSEWHLLPHVHAGYEVHLCGSRRRCLHERLELLHVAQGRHAEERVRDHDHADCERGRRL